MRLFGIRHSAFGPSIRRGGLRVFGIFVSALCILLLPGCVERILSLRSDPPGATVIVNGDPAGVAPCRVRFRTYGVYEVVMSYPGYSRLKERVAVKVPWWETIPIDFFVEDLWPLTVLDNHEATLTLKPVAASDDPAIERREQELRERMQSGEPAPAAQGK